MDVFFQRYCSSNRAVWPQGLYCLATSDHKTSISVALPKLHTVPLAESTEMEIVAGVNANLTETAFAGIAPSRVATRGGGAVHVSSDFKLQYFANAQISHQKK